MKTGHGSEAHKFAAIKIRVQGCHRRVELTWVASLDLPWQLLRLLWAMMLLSTRFSVTSYDTRNVKSPSKWQLLSMTSLRQWWWPCPGLVGLLVGELLGCPTRKPCSSASLHQESLYLCGVRESNNRPTQQGSHLGPTHVPESKGLLVCGVHVHQCNVLERCHCEGQLAVKQWTPDITTTRRHSGYCGRFSAKSPLQRSSWGIG